MRADRGTHTLLYTFLYCDTAARWFGYVGASAASALNARGMTKISDIDTGVTCGCIILTGRAASAIKG
jgi:hypothetical protein